MILPAPADLPKNVTRMGSQQTDECNCAPKQVLANPTAQDSEFHSSEASADSAIQMHQSVRNRNKIHGCVQ